MDTGQTCCFCYKYAAGHNGNNIMKETLLRCNIPMMESLEPFMYWLSDNVDGHQLKQMSLDLYGTHKAS